MNIYLIGMPGAGKSTIGKALAKELNYNFIDLDQVVEDKYQKSVFAILTTSGEEIFRTIETNSLSFVQGSKNVVSCGGGIVVKEENQKLMKGVVIFLNPSIEVLLGRLKETKTRPLLINSDINEIYQSRLKLYQRFCNYQIINDFSVLEAVNKIKDIVQKMKRILVINGPNMNNLANRPQEIYGNSSLESLNQEITDKYPEYDFEFFQSNHEGAIIDKIALAHDFQALVINPAGYTHTSIAIRDALETLKILKVEVHLSDINKRESFRKINYIKDVVDKTIIGKGFKGYFEAIDFIIVKLLKK